MRKLEGKVVVLTGASGGLGKQAAIRMAQEGARLAICARSEDKLLATKALCEQAGAEVIAIPCDVGRYDDLRNFVEQAVERFGTVDVLVNNAITIPLPQPFVDYDVSVLEGVLDTGVVSMWHMMQLCFPYLRERRGVVVNVGAGAGTMGLAGWSAYAAAKAAIPGLSMSVAKEWGEHGIRVNVLCPAALTENSREKLEKASSEHWHAAVAAMSRNLLRRTGDPYADIAPVVVFLACDDSRFITGQTLHVDGGIMMHV